MNRGRSYVDPFHHVKTYQKAYAGRIVPLPDSKFWNKPLYPILPPTLQPLYPILPPTLQRKPGRPKLNRSREEDEVDRPPKRRRICSTCKLPGHHKTTCAGGDVGSNKKATTTKKGAAAKNSAAAKKSAATKKIVPTTNKSTTSQAARRQYTPPTNICSSKKKRNAAYNINPAPSSRDNTTRIPRQHKEYQPPIVGSHVHVRPPNPYLYQQVLRPNAFSQPPPMMAPIRPPGQVFRPQQRVTGSNTNPNRYDGGSSCSMGNNSVGNKHT